MKKLIIMIALLISLTGCGINHDSLTLQFDSAHRMLNLSVTTTAPDPDGEGRECYYVANYKNIYTNNVEVHDYQIYCLQPIDKIKTKI